MKPTATIIALGALLVAQPASAERHPLTNTDGKTIEVELVALEEKEVVVKLGNRRIANIPLDTLTEKDRTFLKSWWEKNKNKLTEMDVRLDISKKTERIDRTVKRSGGNQGGGRGRGGQAQSPVVSKLTEDEFHFVGTLDNYTRKDVSDIEVEYTVYKRVTTKDKEGTKTTVEEIDGTDTIRSLEALGTATFETDIIPCEDSSETGGNKARTYKRETILGIVVRLSAGGEEFLEQGYPDNFLERLEANEDRF